MILEVRAKVLRDGTVILLTASCLLIGVIQSSGILAIAEYKVTALH